jgi:hypothetical protein
MVLLHKPAYRQGSSCRGPFLLRNPDYFFENLGSFGYQKVPDTSGYQNCKVTGFGSAQGNVLK